MLFDAGLPSSNAHELHAADRSARNEERHRFQDLIFYVGQRVFFQSDPPVGLPLGICFHRVATSFQVRQVFVLPQMDDATHGPNMRDEETVGLSNRSGRFVAKFAMPSATAFGPPRS